jgi:hypothetical protein
MHSSRTEMDRHIEITLTIKTSISFHLLTSFCVVKCELKK